jgi:hypothetical protein
MSRIPHIALFHARNGGGGDDDKDRPEDAALVVGEGVPVHLELDPDPDLLVRSTYGSASIGHGSPTHSFIPCRKRGEGMTDLRTLLSL